MGESRVETFKEYRKNMINDEELPEKTQIETSLKTTSSESSAQLTEQEAVFLRRILNRKSFWTVAFIATIAILTAALLTFGLLLF